MTKRLLLFIALMCAVAQGAWAQTEWDIVYAMTQTTSANWTPINAGSTDGYVLGASNTTLTCRGANASGITGAGAGVELSAGNTLHLLGGGRLNANGGDGGGGGGFGGSGGNIGYKTTYGNVINMTLWPTSGAGYAVKHRRKNC